MKRFYSLLFVGAALLSGNVYGMESEVDIRDYPDIIKLLEEECSYHPKDTATQTATDYEAFASNILPRIEDFITTKNKQGEERYARLCISYLNKVFALPESDTAQVQIMFMERFFGDSPEPLAMFYSLHREVIGHLNLDKLDPVIKNITDKKSGDIDTRINTLLVWLTVFDATGHEYERLLANALHAAIEAEGNKLEMQSWERVLLEKGEQLQGLCKKHIDIDALRRKEQASENQPQRLLTDLEKNQKARDIIKTLTTKNNVELDRLCTDDLVLLSTDCLNDINGLVERMIQKNKTIKNGTELLNTWNAKLATLPVKAKPEPVLIVDNKPQPQPQQPKIDQPKIIIEQPKIEQEKRQAEPVKKSEPVVIINNKNTLQPDQSPIIDNSQQATEQQLRTEREAQLLAEERRQRAEEAQQRQAERQAEEQRQQQALEEQQRQAAEQLRQQALAEQQRQDPFIQAVQHQLQQNQAAQQLQRALDDVWRQEQLAAQQRQAEEQRRQQQQALAEQQQRQAEEQQQQALEEEQAYKEQVRKNERLRQRAENKTTVRKDAIAGEIFLALRRKDDKRLKDLLEYEFVGDDAPSGEDRDYINKAIKDRLNHSKDTMITAEDRQAWSKIWDDKLAALPAWEKPKIEQPQAPIIDPLQPQKPKVDQPQQPEVGNPQQVNQKNGLAALLMSISAPKVALAVGVVGVCYWVYTKYKAHQAAQEKESAAAKEAMADKQEENDNAQNVQNA